MANAESVAGDVAGAAGGARFRRKGPVKRTVTYPHGPGVKWPRLYRKFRRKGWTKEKAARVSNEMYNKIKSGQYKRRKPRPPFPGVGGVYPEGNVSALAEGISADIARWGRVNPKTVRKSYGAVFKGEFEPTDAALYAQVKAETKRKFDVYPSAYANGWLVQEYKRRGGKYRKRTDVAKGGLTQWFREEWVDISRPKEGGGFEPCGRKDASKGEYPKCVPLKTAMKMSASEIASAVSRKREAESETKREGKKPIMVSTFEKHGTKGTPGYELLHPRTSRSVSRALARGRRNTPENLATAILDNGGVTFNPRRNERRSSGYAVAISREFEEKFPKALFATDGERIITDYVERHRDVLKKKNVHLGAWVDGDDVYLDMSIVVDDVSAAADIGRDSNQIGIFNLSTFSNWRAFAIDSGQRYIPYDGSDLSDQQYLEALSPAMIGMIDTLAKAHGKPVVFVAGKDITSETIPMIVREILGGEVMKNQPASSDVHVDRPLGSSKYKDPEGGLTAAGRRKFKEETGSNLKPGVKDYDSASTADKKRWISWALRFYGQQNYPPLRKPNGQPTRFALTANAWGEPVPSTEAEARKIAEKARSRKAELERLEKSCCSDCERSALRAAIAEGIL